MLLVSVVSGPACSKSGDSVDKDIEAIRAWAEEGIGGVNRVTCPGTRADTGADFDCAVQFVDGSVHTVSVKYESRNVAYRWVPLIVNGERIAKIVDTWARQDRQPLSEIDCGTGIRRVELGGPLCTGTDKAGARRSIGMIYEGGKPKFEFRRP